MSDEKKAEKPEQPKPEQPKQKRLGLETPKDLKAVYSNAALIANTPAEMVIDFVQILPRSKKGIVQSRVIMSPIHAKMLLKALQHNVGTYEKQYGPIRMPQQTSLADQFFRQPPKKDKDGKGE